MKKYNGFKLLIVDDEARNLFALRTLIESETELEIIETTSGKEALDIVHNHSDIDLIILDIQMPEMDGFQTASMLKIRKKSRDIPIIFLTAAFKSEEFQQKGYSLGAVEYLLKPIDDLLLMNKIGTYFRLIEKERNLNLVLEQRVQERTLELNLANTYLEGILNTMGEALFILNPQGEIRSANPIACKMLDYQESDLLGLTIGDIFEEEEPEQAGAFFGTWLDALVQTGLMRDIDATLIASDGERIPILFSRTAMVHSDGSKGDIIIIAKNMHGFSKIEDLTDE